MTRYYHNGYGVFERHASDRARNIAMCSDTDLAEQIAVALNSVDALEAAELAHANCPECNGEGTPELCPLCFPLFDDARLMRRAALALANEPADGGPAPSTHEDER